MRDVKVVKEQRDALIKQREHVNNKSKAVWDASKDNLTDSTKKLLGYYNGVVTRLSVQINALNYVLNEDTELQDAFYTIKVREGREALDDNLDFKEDYLIEL